MYIEEIQRIPLLSAIDTNILQKCIEKKHIYSQSYAKGITIYNHKDHCHTLDIILTGSLVAYSLSENGSAIAMFEFHANSMMGANLLFNENQEYPLSIYCLEDCELLHIKHIAVAELLHDYSFVMQYIKSLSQNSRDMNRKITMFTQKNLRANILDYLQQQSLIQKTTAITIPMSKKELADYLGVQRPSLFRELKKLKDEKLIEIENRKIKIYQSN